MLKHTETQPVPFEDCGFVRYPEKPLTEEAVTVKCRADHTVHSPALRLWQDGQVTVLQAEQKDGNLYTFALGTWMKPVHLAYQFFTPDEETPLYTFDIHTIQILSALSGVERRAP